MDREAESGSKDTEQEAGPTASSHTSVKGSSQLDQVARTSAFEELVRKKKAFLVPAVIFYLVLYMSMPILGGFTTVLNVQAVGEVTWAFIYALAQFPMVLIVCHLYRNQANKWDRLVDEARQEISEESRTT